MEVSLKLQETFKKSFLVRSGSPAVYHLKPKKEFIGTNMTKLTIGEKDLKKTNRTVLLVGETGAGKSTLINALVNYTMGVKWEDNVWFKMVVEDGAERGNQAQSQTSDVVVYQIFGFEGQTLPYSLTIIDTPGFGDTRGSKEDVIINQRLLDLFRSGDEIHEINVVGLVLKSTENRLTERLSYILDSVMSLFGKDMEKNIVALITHSDGIDPGNALQALEEAKIKVAKDEEGETIHFLFNNHQTTERTADNMPLLKMFWDKTTTKIHHFTEFLDDAEPQSAATAVKVLNDRISLTPCIQNLQERVEFIELKQREIKQTQEALEKHELELKNNEKFSVKSTFRKCSNTTSDSESLLKKLQQEMIKLETDKGRWLDEAFQHIVSLEQITLNVDSLSTHVHLDVLIEKMKERGDTEKVKKLQEIKRRIEQDQKKSRARRFFSAMKTVFGNSK